MLNVLEQLDLCNESLKVTRDEAESLVSILSTWWSGIIDIKDDPDLQDKVGVDVILAVNDFSIDQLDKMVGKRYVISLDALDNEQIIIRVDKPGNSYSFASTPNPELSTESPVTLFTIRLDDDGFPTIITLRNNYLRTASGNEIPLSFSVFQNVASNIADFADIFDILSIAVDTVSAGDFNPSSLYSKVMSMYANLSGKAAQVFSELLTAIQGGAFSTLSYVKRVLKTFSSAQYAPDQGVIEFSDIDFELGKMPGYVIAVSALNTLAEAVGFVAMMFAKAVGAVVLVAGFVAKFIASTISDAAYLGTKASINFTRLTNNRCLNTPLITMRLKDGDSGYTELLSFCNSNEQTCLTKLLFAGLEWFIWIDDGTNDVCVQAFPSARGFADPAPYKGYPTNSPAYFTWVNGTYQPCSRYNDPNNVIVVKKEDMFGLEYSFFSKNYEFVSNGSCGDESLDDYHACLSCCNSLLQFIYWVSAFSPNENGSLSLPQSDDWLNATYHTHTYSQYPDTIQPLTPNYWEDIFGPLYDSMKFDNVFHPESSSALWSTDSWRLTLIQLLLHGVNYSSVNSGLSFPVTSKGEDFILAPTVARSHVSQVVMITGLIVAATTIIAISATSKFNKFRKRKRAELTARANKAWNEYVANPNQDTYKAYQSAVTKNNLWGSLFLGSSKLSRDGFTRPVPTSNTNNSSSGLMNLVSVNEEGQVVSLSSVIDLIKPKSK